VAPEQVAIDDDEQPEPDNECEYRNHVHQEISIGESFLGEEHCDPLVE
jgi:hypothetical protein